MFVGIKKVIKSSRIHLINFAHTFGEETYSGNRYILQCNLRKLQETAKRKLYTESNWQCSKMFIEIKKNYQKIVEFIS